MCARDAAHPRCNANSPGPASPRMGRLCFGTCCEVHAICIAIAVLLSSSVITFLFRFRARRVSDPLYILYISFFFSPSVSPLVHGVILPIRVSPFISVSPSCVYIFLPFIPIFLDSPLSSTIDANLLRLFHPMDPKVSLPVGVVILVARATRR